MQIEQIYGIRKDFPFLKNNQDAIYLDSAATSLKPTRVIDAMMNYYTKYTSNTHSLDHSLAVKTTGEVEKTRELVAKFTGHINSDIVFTSGATEGLNMVVFGYYAQELCAGDEVILNRGEHASNVLPWIELEKQKRIKLVYCDLTPEGEITLENIQKIVTHKTKVIALAYVGNVVGYKNDVKEICKYAKESDIDVVLDASQAAPHTSIKNLGATFMVFSAHKMCGPTGVGVLCGDWARLRKIKPLYFGGGMNANFSLHDYSLKAYPTALEAGTPPIAEIIGLGAAIEYLNSIGMDKIEKYTIDLKRYAVKKLKEIDGLILYSDNDGPLITFNIKGIPAQDLGTYLNSQKIYVRTGHHCAKLLTHVLDADEFGGTVRASLYFYNTKEDINVLVDACKKIQEVGDLLDVFF